MRCVLLVVSAIALVACNDGSADQSADEQTVEPTAEATQPIVPELPAAYEEPSGPTAQVVNVVDGDTIDVVIDGVEERVRYIGIDSPERGACFEDEATSANEELVSGHPVTLEADAQNDRDIFGRLLRYVHVDGVFVNQELVAGGFAEATTRYPERTYRDVLLAAEADAKAAGRGLWSACPGLFE